MRTYDLANMLGAFDESFNILIKFLETGKHDLALIRAKKMQSSLHKVMGFLDCKESKDAEQRMIDKL